MEEQLKVFEVCLKRQGHLFACSKRRLQFFLYWLEILCQNENKTCHEIGKLMKQDYLSAFRLGFVCLWFVCFCLAYVLILSIYSQTHFMLSGHGRITLSKVSERIYPATVFCTLFCTFSLSTVWVNQWNQKKFTIWSIQ